MAKTLLKSVLVILVLAGVFFAALQIWEKRKTPVTTEEAPPPVEAPAKPMLAIREVTVQPLGEGASIQIRDLPNSNYRVSKVDQPKSLVVEVPGASLQMPSNSISSPHALISSIQANSTFAMGQSQARIDIQLSQDVDYKERLIGTALVIELSPKMQIETPTPEPAVVRKPVEKKKSSKKKVTKRTPRKPKVVEPPPIEEPVFTPEPLPEPAVGDSAPIDDLLNMPVGEGTEEPFVPVDQPPAVPPVAENVPPPAQEPAPQPDDLLDLDALFSDVQDTGGPGGDAGAPSGDLPAPTQMAMIPPGGGKFNPSDFTSGLPGVTSLDVQNEGGVTTVRIARDAKMKYKVFRMRNPDRVVVEFLNAQNRLQPEYQGFPGTRVNRVTSQQFAGPDGALTRIMLYVDGKTEYQNQQSGNDFILKLP